MKIFTRICLIVSGVCVCIAAICLGIGLALGSGFREVQQMADSGELDFANWHIGNGGFYWKDDDFTASEVEVGSISKRFMADEVNSLYIDIKYGEVYLIDSDSDEITIQIDAPKRNRYKCENDDATVKLEDATSSFIWNFGIGRKDDVTVTIAVPKDKEFDEITLTTSAGTTEARHAFTAKEIHMEIGAGTLSGESFAATEEMSVEVGAGELEITKLQAGNLKIDCGVGEVKLAGTVSKDVDADCGVGEITMLLNGKEDEYDYEISCGVGEVSVNGRSYSSLATEEKIHNRAENKICLDCGVGEIHVTVEED